MNSNLTGFAQSYTRAWCSGQPERVAEHFAPAGSLRVNGGEKAIGRQAIAAVAASFMTAFPDLEVLLDRLESAGDRVEYHWTLRGTNTGPDGTGRFVQVSGFESWKLGADGQIEESEGQFDAEEYRRQLEA